MQAYYFMHLFTLHVYIFLLHIFPRKRGNHIIIYMYLSWIRNTNAISKSDIFTKQLCYA